MDKVQELRQAYGWLKAFASSVPEGNVKATYIDDYARIHSATERSLGTTLGDFSPTTLRKWSGGDNNFWCTGAEVKSRALQLLGFLEYGYNIEDKVAEIGSLYKAIRDQELRERCADLIVGAGPFDRVINQATLVLEERLRNRAGLDRSNFGPGLVNAAVKSDPTESLIVFSTMKAEQEGYANILRGIMQALRNETHHTTGGDFSREDALSICGFIDRILRLIDQSLVKR